MRIGPKPALSVVWGARPQDCHPGNILVRDDGAVCLLDFGQAKQLARPQRLAFARLLIALAAAENAPLDGVLRRLAPAQQAAVTAALAGLGIRTGPGSSPGCRPPIREQCAHSMRLDCPHRPCSYQGRAAGCRSAAPDAHAAGRGGNCAVKVEQPQLATSRPQRKHMMRTATATVAQALVLYRACLPCKMRLVCKLHTLAWQA